MKLLNFLKPAIIVLGLASGSAQAATVNFAVDDVTSTASASVTGCFFCFADISATAVGGGTNFSLNVGETSAAFDFVRFTASGFGFGAYNVSATLAFSDPGGSISSSGGGVFGTFFGAISGGILNWDDAVQQVVLGDGTSYTVALSDGFAVTTGSAISQATVTLNSSAVPVPLPSAALLLIAGLGGLGVAKRRSRRAEVA